MNNNKFPATRLYALRHGETEWNVETRIQGNLNICLNDKGHEQAARLGAALAKRHQHEPITAIYSSDLWRAYDTALAISKAIGIPVVTDEGLRERGFGFFEGMSYAEIEAKHPEMSARWRARDPHFCPEGGESLTQFRDRILTASQAITARHAGEQIVVVAHGGVLDVLYRAANGLEIQAKRDWNLGNAVINRLSWVPTTFSMVSWNDTSHLEEDALNEAHA